MLNKFFFKEPFFPQHEVNKMDNEGDISSSRNNFLSKRFNNLDFLLSQRYSWMNEYILPHENVIEIGSGSGFSKLYLNNKNIVLTDATDNPWIDKYLDATNMDLDDNSIDVIIASHTIHHFYNPAKFFDEASRVLKKNGKIIISEINTSLLMRFLLKAMKHEGYSYNVDIFSRDSIVNDKNDLWSANCAVPEMLFKNNKEFENNFPSYRVVHNSLCESLIFPASGGVIAKKKVPELPTFMLQILNVIDKLLILVLPSIFALGRRIVLEKK